ncbi:MAG: TldD/PmbA family protein [Parcubacteria group bacterium]|nr:TldD/PmbA family protein [Parcubacteria group bacterium]
MNGENHMKNTAVKIFSLVSGLGGTAASVSFSRTENKDLSVRNGEVENQNINRSRGIDIAVWFGNKVAAVSGVGQSDAEIIRLAERACAMAKASQADPFALLAQESLWPKNISELAAELELYDDRDLSLAEMKQFALSLEMASMSVPGVSRSDGAGVQQTKRFHAFYTTEGFEGAFESASYGADAACIAGTGENMQMWREGDIVRHFALLRDPEELGRLAGETAASFLGAENIPSETLPVVFSHYVSSSILGHLKQAINGELIHQESSFFNREKIGGRIFSPGINIVSNPLLPKLTGSFPFDGEGIAGKKLDIVRDGVLQSFLTDLRSAAKLGTEPTGQTGNLHMENGALSREELIADIPRGFLVMEFLGQGPNISTGDYSRGARGFLIENGKITRPVDGVTVAGNLTDMFTHITPASDMLLGLFNTPTLRIDGMTVAGKE